MSARELIGGEITAASSNRETGEHSSLESSVGVPVSGRPVVFRQGLFN